MHRNLETRTWHESMRRHVSIAENTSCTYVVADQSGRTSGLLGPCAPVGCDTRRDRVLILSRKRVTL
jgi:hypothetical protein